jgi:hypothetical protein
MPYPNTTAARIADPEKKTESFMGDGYKFRISEAQSDGLIIDVHVISPGWGSSGYYSEAVLQKACADGVYPAGMHMHIDHPTREAEESQPARTLQGESPLAAIFTEPGQFVPSGWDGTGVYTRAKVLPAFVEDIRAMAGHIGISHYVSGVSEVGEAEGKKGAIIKELIADPLNTVDFVTVPGAGGHYRTLGEALAESHIKTQEAKMPEKFTIEDVKANSKIMEALRADIMKEADGEKLAEKLAESQTENKKLTEALKATSEKLIRQESRTYALAKLAESKLPAMSQKRVVESLTEAPVKDDKLDTVEFDKAIEAAIKAEQDYIDAIVKESGASGAHSLPGKKVAESAEDARQIYFESLVNAGKPVDIAKKMAGVD